MWESYLFQFAMAFIIVMSLILLIVFGSYSLIFTFKSFDNLDSIKFLLYSSYSAKYKSLFFRLFILFVFNIKYIIS